MADIPAGRAWNPEMRRTSIFVGDATFHDYEIVSVSTGQGINTTHVLNTNGVYNFFQSGGSSSVRVGYTTEVAGSASAPVSHRWRANIERQVSVQYAPLYIRLSPEANSTSLINMVIERMQ